MEVRASLAPSKPTSGIHLQGRGKLLGAIQNNSSHIMKATPVHQPVMMCDTFKKNYKHKHTHGYKHANMFSHVHVH